MDSGEQFQSSRIRKLKSLAFAACAGFIPAVITTVLVHTVGVSADALALEDSEPQSLSEYSLLISTIAGIALTTGLLPVAAAYMLTRRGSAVRTLLFLFAGLLTIFWSLIAFAFFADSFAAGSGVGAGCVGIVATWRFVSGQAGEGRVNGKVDADSKTETLPGYQNHLAPGIAAQLPPPPPPPPASPRPQVASIDAIKSSNEGAVEIAGHLELAKLQSSSTSAVTAQAIGEGGNGQVQKELDSKDYEGPIHRQRPETAIASGRSEEAHSALASAHSAALPIVENSPKDAEVVPAEVVPAELEDAISPSPTAPKAQLVWPDDLFATAIFKQQYESQRGHKVTLDRLGAILKSLDAAGGRSSRSELAKATGIPEARLPGLLAQSRNVLNIDGYSVLDDDGELVKLRQDTALVQFGIK